MSRGPGQAARRRPRQPGSQPPPYTSPADPMPLPELAPSALCSLHPPPPPKLGMEPRCLGSQSTTLR